MKIKSDIYDGLEFDVELFDAKDGKKGIKSDSIEDILYNQLPKELEVKHDIQIISANGTYCAVKCIIEDVHGRKVYGFSDVSLEHLEKDDEFPKQHPLIQATQYAMATAVKSYLNWPRLLLDDNDKVPEEPEIDDNGVTLDDLEVNDAETESGPNEDSEFTGMNPPLDEAPVATESGENGSDKNMDDTKNDEDFSQYTLEELGKLTVKTGTYKGKTLEEMWESQPSWFDFVLNKSKSTKYDNAREFALRKEKE